MKTQGWTWSLAAAAGLGLLLGGATLAAAESHHRKTEVVRELPSQTTVVRVGDREYDLRGDRSHGEVPGGFLGRRPAVGTVVARLPEGRIEVTIGGLPYLLAGGVYFQKSPRGYLVAGELLRHRECERVAVEAKRLNVRSGPGNRFPVIAVAHRGETLRVAGTAPGWHYVQLSPGRFGWVMSRFLETPARG